jgi:hypothetical protein
MGNESDETLTLTLGDLQMSKSRSRMRNSLNIGQTVKNKLIVTIANE